MSLSKLGKYEIIDKLGEGATAEVYLARDTVLKRQVSLKILKPALVADPTAFERFGREAQAAAGLFHPSIATVLDMGEADGRYFIAMRYTAGQPLDKFIAEHGALSWDETLRLIRQMSEALDYAHEQGFLHRDVKPSNIIRSPKGDYVLTDFGLQRAMLSTGLTTHTGVVLGTPPYIAPEVWNGKAAVGATDQYALACVIYEALTGDVLFAGDTPMAVLKRHSEGWIPPAKWPQGAPKGLEQVFRRALAQEPEDRYESMGQLASALEELRSGSSAMRQSPRPDDTGALAETGNRLEGSTRKVPASRDAGSGARDASSGLPALPRGWRTLLASLVIIMVLIGAVIMALRHPAAVPVAPGAPVATLATSVTEAPTSVSTETPAATAAPALAIGSTVNASSNSTVATLPTEITDAKSVPMRLVPGGDSIMGSDKGKSDERPVHQVYLLAYYMDKFEVTNILFQACVAAGVCGPPHDTSSFTHSAYYGNSKYDNYPVVNVDWFQASAYCEWRGASLPTEAQWEKAARGTDGRTYPMGEEIDCSRANYWGNLGACVGDTTEVGSYPNGVSPYGIYDMAGNVWEKVADWYSETFYQSSAFGNPLGANNGQSRAARGGGWNTDASDVRTSRRGMDVPTYWIHNNGFRCAKPAP